MQNPFEVVIQNQADDEEIVKVWRHHAITLAGPILRVIAVLLVPILLLVITGLSMFGHPVLFVLYGLILAICLTYAAYEWVSWYNDVYILTNYRIVDVQQTGFFHRKFVEASLSKIQDISFQVSGVFQTFLNYGDVEVSTAGPLDNIYMAAVSRPDNQASFLLKHQHEFVQQHDDTMSAEQLITLLAKHGDKLDKLSDLEKAKKMEEVEEQMAKAKEATRKRKTKKAKKEAKEV